MTIRPAWAGAWLASRTRMILTGLRTEELLALSRLALLQRLMFVTEFTFNSQASTLTLAVEGLPCDGVLVNQRHRPCTEARTPGATNDEVFMSNLSACVHISMVLRINPTASPSISKASPGSTTMVW